MLGQLTYTAYDPSDRQKLVHEVGNAPGSSVVIKGAVGGLGGGKSTCMEQEQVMICLSTPGGRSLAMRKSMNRSELSVLDDYQRILNGVAKWVASKKRFEFDNGHHLIVCPADDWDRFGSTQLVSFYIQEAQEVEFQIFDTLTQRLRDPHGVVGGIPYYTGLLCARGVKREHWVYREFAVKAWDVDRGKDQRSVPPKGVPAKTYNPDFALIKFSTYDNKAVLDRISPGYIDNQIRHHKDNEAWIKMMIEGEFGFDVEGRPVYECFRGDRHIAEIVADPTLPILRGWDFGYNRPAVVFCQYDRDGRFFVLRELCPTGVSREELCTMVNALQQREWPSRHPSQYRDFGDAAGDHENTAGVPDLDFVESFFSTSVESKRARVNEGLEMVRGLMMRSTKKGDPRFVVDSSCERLIDALRGAYYYRADKTDERPIKGNGYDDVADALRYTVQLVVEENFGRQTRVGQSGSSTQYAAY